MYNLCMSTRDNCFCNDDIVVGVTPNIDVWLVQLVVLYIAVHVAAYG